MERKTPKKLTKGTVRHLANPDVSRFLRTHSEVSNTREETVEGGGRLAFQTKHVGDLRCLSIFLLGYHLKKMLRGLKNVQNFRRKFFFHKRVR